MPAIKVEFRGRDRAWIERNATSRPGRGPPIVVDERGLSVFNALRYRLRGHDAVLCAFDLLELDGADFYVRVSTVASRTALNSGSPWLGSRPGVPRWWNTRPKMRSMARRRRAVGLIPVQIRLFSGSSGGGRSQSTSLRQRRATRQCLSDAALFQLTLERKGHRSLDRRTGGLP